MYTLTSPDYLYTTLPTSHVTMSSIPAGIPSLSYWSVKDHTDSKVKQHVKVQVSKILPRIEQAVNEQLEAKVLTRSSHSSRTSYVFAADLSEMELKKILIEKMEGNKSIQRSDEQRNLYKALVDAYEFDKEGKEPKSASAPTKTATRSAGRSTQRSRSRQASASESALAEEPMQTTSQMEEPSHLEFDTGADDQPNVQSSQHPEWFPQQQISPTLDRDWNKTLPAIHESILPWISELAKQANTRASFNELMDTPLDFSNFLMNRLSEPIDYDKHALWEVSHLGRKHQQFYGFAIN
nr:hypothetical protein [Tanacetum cinerariifolium]